VISRFYLGNFWKVWRKWKRRTELARVMTRAGVAIASGEIVDVRGIITRSDDDYGRSGSTDPERLLRRRRPGRSSVEMLRSIEKMEKI
jgi:hypothetical protein